ncbi:MAG: cysteine--tRNA ligase [Cyanobacteriota/Melainabacteria group bacterium]
MSDLQLFNTLTGKKETFLPRQGKTVHMYACGPTVYDMSHLGHARTFIVWDVVQRYLRYSGYDVVYVRNITDVDDKIINRAKEKDVQPDKVAREFIYHFWNDMHRLNIEAPDFEPRCTEYIALMIDFIEALIQKGHAYASEGDVYFKVESFKDYGKLGKKTVEDLLVGAREQTRSQEELKERKQSPVDFALWKGADKSEPGWQSPWGYGRPGWHLECSTMIKEVLGETIDIHAGGEDLVFPHHENEIAQSNCLHGAPLARYWLHNGFVKVNAEKMSKSLGNFSTIDGLLGTFSADTIRLFVLQTHYRHPIDFSIDSLKSAATAMGRLLRAARFAEDTDSHKNGNEIGNVQDDVTEALHKEFIEAMNNDFNTAQAVSALFSFADKIFNLKGDEKKQQEYARVLKSHAMVLGLTLEDNRQQLDSDTSAQLVELLLNLRDRARQNKDYQASDFIRDQLAAQGISVMDSKEGATWEKA